MLIDFHFAFLGVTFFVYLNYVVWLLNQVVINIINIICVYFNIIDVVVFLYVKCKSMEDYSKTYIHNNNNLMQKLKHNNSNTQNNAPSKNGIKIFYHFYRSTVPES